VDAATRATLLGVILAACIASVGWLMRQVFVGSIGRIERALDKQTDRVTDHAERMFDLIEKMDDRMRKSEARLERLEATGRLEGRRR